MLFTTVEFAVFFLFVLTINWLLKNKSGWYRYFLLSANFFFYSCFDVRFLPLLISVGLINWFFGYTIAGTKSDRSRKWLMAAAVVLNLGQLAFFKYFEFFVGLSESLLIALGIKADLPITEIIFPIGISFFTFQGLGYTIDVYRDRYERVKRLPDLMLFVSFFPTVLSGPIMRARDFIPQLTRTKYDPVLFQTGFALILAGMFKKIVIASYLSEHIVRQVFQVPINYSSLTNLMAVYGYSIQIYCDFSGYSDLAMGVALLMGFDIPLNFRQPYKALNFQEFWHRWHISLSTWLRDYLYISLGGNRLGRFRKYLNLMLTMILGGLWHGAHSRFILWGALHGFGLVLTHLWNDYVKVRFKKRPKVTHGPNITVTSGLVKFICWLATFNAVSFLWVFFRAENADRAFEIFGSILKFTQPGMGFELLVIAAIVVGLGMQFVGGPVERVYLGLQRRLPFPLQALVIALLTIIILRLGPDGVLPFIYFQF